MKYKEQQTKNELLNLKMIEIEEKINKLLLLKDQIELIDNSLNYSLKEIEVI